MTQTSKRTKTTNAGRVSRARDSHPVDLAMDSHPIDLMRALNMLNTKTNAQNPFLQPSDRPPQANQQHRQEGATTDRYEK